MLPFFTKLSTTPGLTPTLWSRVFGPDIMTEG